MTPKSCTLPTDDEKKVFQAIEITTTKDVSHRRRSLKWWQWGTLHAIHILCVEPHLRKLCQVSLLTHTKIFLHTLWVQNINLLCHEILDKELWTLEAFSIPHGHNFHQDFFTLFCPYFGYFWPFSSFLTILKTFFCQFHTSICPQVHECSLWRFENAYFKRFFWGEIFDDDGLSKHLWLTLHAQVAKSNQHP